MRAILFLAGILSVFCAQVSCAEISAAQNSIIKVSLSDSIQSDSSYSRDVKNFRGWNYLAGNLVRDGVSPEKVRVIYSSPRLPYFSRIYFGLNPKEKPSIYSSFTAASRVKLARQCYASNLAHLNAAEEFFKIPKEVVASIIFVETNCGKVTGRDQIVYRLSRLASVGDPDNVKANFAKLYRQDRTVTMEQVLERARYLETTFYPEIEALIQISDMHKVSIFDIKGSSAGAFGIAQFLPSSYLKYGFDGDNDSNVSLFSPSDAIWSTANFLAQNGWDKSKSLSENKGVLWNYNRSDAYGDAVLKLAGLIANVATK